MKKMKVMPQTGRNYWQRIYEKGPVFRIHEASHNAVIRWQKYTAKV